MLVEEGDEEFADVGGHIAVFLLSFALFGGVIFLYDSNRYIRERGRLQLVDFFTSVIGN